MDYEEKYKKTLEKARKELQACGSVDCDAAKQIFRFFPELAEPEDEKIRKAIIEFFELQDDNTTYSLIPKKDILAWLEKQGEPVEINPTEFDTRLQSLVGKFGNLPKEELIGSLSFWLNVVQNDKTYKDEEKQGEQNLADKVEPRFKIEEEKWYVCTQTYVLRGKIVVIKGQTYQAEKDNVIKGEDGCLFIDRHDGKASDYFRSWTIDNAKNDDVLCYKNEISLYKHDIKNCNRQGTTFGGFVYYCCYDGKRFVVDSLYSLTEQDKMDIHPATKEQRDQLEKAMADAGYTFDFEKKELKKIEQKSAWSEEDERIYQSIMDDTVQENQLNDKQTNWLRDIKYRYFPQPKQEWSEDDIKMFVNIKACLRNANKDYSREVDWLISLKDGVHLQARL